MGPRFIVKVYDAGYRIYDTELDGWASLPLQFEKVAYHLMREWNAGG